ncbi:MAG TPA: cation-transporting P-type ATPase [Solirubrobacteraceae bacterium]|nr:cation-transporting P-type ATPase [Solirubrobacteraceae bacterium]
MRHRPSPRSDAPAGAGLTTAEARERIVRVGPNVLDRSEGPPWWLRFGRNLVHLFAILLWAGAALAAIAGMPQLAIAIVVVILVNAVFSFAQEHRAERAVEALGRVLPQRARVRRDGRPQEVDARELVPGDLVLLAPGERISADAVLVSAVELRVDMSTLTGESRPVRRHAAEGDGGDGFDAPDRVFAGTHVFSGTAEAVVAATGMKTELGRIAGLTQGAERRPSPLELEMRRVTRVVALLSVLIGVTFFVVAGTLGMPLTDRFLFAIGVIVANVPEGLLPTVTLSLALATQRMARRNAIVRRLSSVETLGCTTVICTDKTGTLTTNEMTVRRVWTPSGAVEVEGVGFQPEGRLAAHDEAVVELARAGALCNDATLEQRDGVWHVVGDPTEGALLTLARKAQIDPVLEAHRRPRLGEVPFDSRRKRMTTVHDSPEGPMAYTKGAPALVVARTSLSAEARARALAAADDLARDGLRVLALARRPVEPGAVVSEALEEELELLGLVGMQDPPRPEVAAAVTACHGAGIRIVMVTGDHGITAEAIARRIGLVGRRARIIQGDEIDGMADDELATALAAPDALVARVTPEQKLRIAAVLHGAGEIVAMTGDGVNDAPALRTADIGIAMGRSGTDVAREAADMVLADDNFASIAAAVEEGRAVYDNIRRFAQYHFSSNVAELLAFLAWGLSGGAIPLPLVVMQVLAIDLGTDLVPAIALGTERPEPGVMRRPPRPRRERLLNARTLGRVYGFVGLVVGAAGIAAFLVGYVLAGWRPGEPLPDAGPLYVQATAMTYAGIVAGQVGAGFAFRTARESLLRVGVLSNRFLLVGIAFEIVLLLAILHLGPLQSAFHTRALDPVAWPLLACVPFVVVAAEEARKAAFRRWVWKERPA